MAKQKKARRTQTGRDVKSKIRSNKSASAAESKLSKNEQFRLEYAYVFKDLRTVFILAAIMFALLIALNLVLQ